MRTCFPALAALLAALPCADAPAQVSTFTRDGGGVVTLAPTYERPASRLYVGRTHVNAHDDAHPGLARALAPDDRSPAARPLDYGASPTLANVAVAVNVGPTAIAFSPWRQVRGGGQLKHVEAARVDFLERYGFLGGVREHRNLAAPLLEALRTPPTPPAPRDEPVSAEPLVEAPADSATVAAE